MNAMAMAKTWVMVLATMWPVMKLAMARVTREIVTNAKSNGKSSKSNYNGDKEGKGNSIKSDGNGNKEGNGNGRRDMLILVFCTSDCG
jgi:hypothetical protein